MKPITDQEFTYNEDARTAAEKRGMVVLSPRAGEYFIDLDSEQDCESFVRRVERCSSLLGIVQAEAWPSSSPRHFHVSIRSSHSFGEYERLFMEVCLGGDPVRGMLAWRMMRDEHVRISCLFVPAEHHLVPRVLPDGRISITDAIESIVEQDDCAF